MAAPARAAAQQDIADPWAVVSTTPNAEEALGPAPPDPWAVVSVAPVTRLPTAQEAFGPPPTPTAEEAFGPRPAKGRAQPDPWAVVKSIDTTIKRRGSEGVDQLARGGREIMSGLGANGDRMDVLRGAMDVVGGGWKAAMSPVSGYVERAAGPLAEKLGGSRAGIGDVTDQALGLVAPVGPKGPKPVAAVAREAAPVIEGEARVLASAADDPWKVVGQQPAKPTTTEEAFGPKTMAASVEDNLDDVIYGPARGRKPPTGSTPPEPAVTGAREGLVEVAGAVQKILAPATVGLGQDAASILRSNAARGDLMAAKAADALGRHAREVAKLDEGQRLALIDYLQNRSLGAKIPDPKLQAFADTHRKVMADFENAIGDTLDLGEADSAPFLRDYYSQMWRETGTVVEGRIRQSRQGSNRNLRARSIPTVKDGIVAGLTPVTTDPIEMDMIYAGNMARYLSTVNAQKALMGEGLAAFNPVGHQPEGWVPLNGIRASKPGRQIIQDGELVKVQPEQKLFAPADVARVYNNWISQGLETGDAGPLFTAARKAANGMTMLKLGLSAFHATTMANEAIVSEMARAWQSLSQAPGHAAQGRFGEAAASLGRGAKAMAASPAAPVTSYLRGAAMRRELLGRTGAKSVESQLRNDAFIEAGGRVRMDRLYRARESGSFYNAIANGTWRSELKRSAENIFGKDRLVSQRAMGVVDLGANLIQSVAAPLFEHAIPRLKLGAFDSAMSDWMAANPLASESERRAAAHLINRSIDNRFGEMAWDNLFWHRWLKQASQILLLSPTWNLGTINEIGGGLLDMLGRSAKGMVTGGGLTTRSAYVAALATEVALVNGVMTYLKTGTAPAGADFLAYRTGGTDAASGKPERGLVPGYQKDVYAFGHGLPSRVGKLFADVAQSPEEVGPDVAGLMQRAWENAGEEAAHKLNPALSTAVQLATNKDFRGLPIYPGDGAQVGPADRGVGDYLLEQFTPISVEQLRQGDKIGSNLSPMEKVMAVRPAPAYLQDPERVERLQRLRDRREWERKRLAERRDRTRRTAP